MHLINPITDEVILDILACNLNSCNVNPRTLINYNSVALKSIRLKTSIRKCRNNRFLKSVKGLMHVRYILSDIPKLYYKKGSKGKSIVKSTSGGHILKFNSYKEDAYPNSHFNLA